MVNNIVDELYDDKTAAASDGKDIIKKKILELKRKKDSTQPTKIKFKYRQRKVRRMGNKNIESK